MMLVGPVECGKSLLFVVVSIILVMVIVVGCWQKLKLSKYRETTLLFSWDRTAKIKNVLAAVVILNLAMGLSPLLL